MVSYDTVIYHSTPYSTRLTPIGYPFVGYILGTALTLTSNVPTISGNFGGLQTGLPLIGTSSVVPGTTLTPGQQVKNAGAYTVTVSQTVGSSGSPVTFMPTYDG